MNNLTQSDLNALTPAQRKRLQQALDIDRATLINRLLAQVGLNQSLVSRQYNVPLSSINQTITGKRPNPKVRRILADATGMPEEVLFDHQDRVAA